MQTDFICTARSPEEIAAGKSETWENSVNCNVKKETDKCKEVMRLKKHACLCFPCHLTSVYCWYGI